MAKGLRGGKSFSCVETKGFLKRCQSRRWMFTNSLPTWGQTACGEVSRLNSTGMFGGEEVTKGGRTRHGFTSTCPGRLTRTRMSAIPAPASPLPKLSLLTWAQEPPTPKLTLCPAGHLGFLALCSQELMHLLLPTLPSAHTHRHTR